MLMIQRAEIVPMGLSLQFLGATRQVTGSCYLLTVDDTRILVDGGMFQERDYQSRNWSAFPFDPKDIDFLLLTHAHLDHTGLIPKLAHDGLTAPILTTAASRDIAQIILEDAAHIQEEDAAYKKKRHQKEGRSGAYPETSLYSVRDVQTAMLLFKPVSYHQPVTLNDAVTAVYHDAGHILGSAMIELTVKAATGTRTIVFSGDIGQSNKPIVRDPATFARADYVVMESTYGGRRHDKTDEVADQFSRIINETVEAGGNLIIPTFAVERAQELLFHLGRLVYDDRIPNLTAFLDSPMAVDVTDVFRRHRDLMDEEAKARWDAGERLFRFPGLKLIQSSQDSKGINRFRGSSIILAGSGMCTAGRIKHHLVLNIARPECTILFVGYQAEGTLGREILDGKKTVRILGETRKVKARIEQVQGLSAHADHDGLMSWIGSLQSPPRSIFLTHGEASAAEALAQSIREDLAFDVQIPTYRQSIELT